MKKLIGIAAVALTLAASAFAEISFGWGTTFMLVPVASDGDNIRTAMQTPWGQGARVIDLGVSGVSDNGKAGFATAIRQYADYTTGTGDNVLAWWKPIEQIKLSFGIFDDGYDGLREGNGNFGLWDWLRADMTCIPGSGVFNGDSGIFDGKGGDGFMAHIMPIKGLTFVVNIPFMVEGKIVNDAWDVYKGTMVKAAYTIDGVGTIKAGWWGKGANVSKDEGKYENAKFDFYDYTGRVGVAFDLTAVENLYVAIGAKFDIADKDYANWAIFRTTYKDEKADKAYIGQQLSTALITLNAFYKIADRLTISLAGGVNILKAEDFDPVFGVGGGLSFDITDALTVLADVRYHSALKYNNNGIELKTKDALSFLVGIQYAFSTNVNVGIGFQGITNGGGGGIKEAKISGSGLGKIAPHENDFMWAVPIRVSLSI